MAEKDEGGPGRSALIREAYAGPDDLDEKAAAWLDAVKPYERHAFKPSRLGRNPALLVIDMQRFFLEEGGAAFLPAGRAVLPRIKELAEAFRAHRRPVVFTGHVDRPRDGGGSMYRWWGHLMRAEDPMTAVHPDLTPWPGELLLWKSQYSAFVDTRLESELRAWRTTCVVVAGVMTHLCCESTARDAFMRGFDVIAVADGTATLNETLHVASLRSLSHGFAVPARAKEVMEGLAR